MGDVAAMGGTAVDYLKQRDTGERRMVASVRAATRRIAAVAAPYWGLGDGCGGYVAEIIRKELEAAGLILRFDELRALPTGTRFIFDRDGWECRHCGNHRDLTVDHITPRALGGKSHPDNLQTLCALCNSKKGAR